MLLSVKAKHDFQLIRVEYNKYRLEELVPNPDIKKSFTYSWASVSSSINKDINSCHIVETQQFFGE